MVTLELEGLAEALYRFLRSRSVPDDEAMDLVQETLLRALRGRRGLRDAACFRGFAYGIARNLLADARRGPRWGRARALAPDGEDTAAAAAPGADPAAHDDARSVQSALEALPEDLREVVVLHYYDDLTYEEIAAALDVPRPTVQGRLRRAKEALRDRLRGAFAADDDVAARASVRAALGAGIGCAGALPPAPGAIGERVQAVLDATASAPVAPVSSAAAGAVVALAVGCAALAVAWLGVRSSGDPASPGRAAAAATAGDLAASEPGPLEATGPEVAAGREPDGRQSFPPARRDSPGGAAPAEPPGAALVPGADGAAPPAGGEPLGARIGEPEGEPPPYPFADPSPGPLERTLQSRKMTINFPDVPLEDAVAFFNDLELPVAADASFAAKEIRLTLRLKDIVVTHALAIIATQVGGEVLYDERAGVARIVEEVPRHLAEARERRAILEGGDVDEEWKKTLVHALAERRVTLTFPGIPLGEALEFLRDITLLNYVTDPDVDRDLPVTVELRNASLGDALAAVLASADPALRHELRDQAFRITAAPEDTSPRLAERQVSLALIGATVPDLVRALEAAGVSVVVGPESWASRGTFSLVLDGDVPLAEGVRAIGAQAGLGAGIVLLSQRPRREVLVLRGAVPSVRAALADGPPADFPGVVADWAERRARILALCEARAQARERRPLDRADLHRRENEVAHAAADLAKLRDRIGQVLLARDHRVRAESELVPARERRAALEAEVARADALVAEAESSPSPEAPEWTKVPADDPARDRERIAAIEEVDRAQRDRAKLTEERLIARARAESTLAAASQRIEELERVLAAARRDVAILERLERGERPAAAGIGSD